MSGRHSATEGPPGSRYCSTCRQHKDDGEFSSLRTCQSCATNKERRISQQIASSNTTAAVVEEWQPEAFVAQGSEPVIVIGVCDAQAAPAELCRATEGESEQHCMTAAESEQTSLPATQMGVVTQEEIVAPPANNSVKTSPSQPGVGMTFNFTPPGSEPVSDDVDSAMDDVTHMLAQQLNLGHSSALLNDSASDVQAAIASSFEHNNQTDASAQVCSRQLCLFF